MSQQEIEVLEDRSPRKPGEAGRLAGLRLLVRTGWRASPGLSLGSAALFVVLSLSHVAAFGAVAVVVSGAVERDMRRAGLGALLFASVAATRQAAGWAADTISMALRERTAMALEARMLELAATIPGIEHHERPELLDQMAQLREARFALGDVVSAVLNSLATLVQIAATLLVLAGVDPALLLLPLVGVLPIGGDVIAERIKARAGDRFAQDHRVAVWLRDAAMRPRSAGDLRLGGLSSLVLRRHREAHDAILALYEPARWRADALQVVGEIVFTAVQLVAIGFVALRAAEGDMTVATAVFAIGLVGRVGSQMGDVSIQIDWGLWALRSVSRLAWLEGEAAAADAAVAVDRPEPLPHRLREGIRLNAVSFAYPGTSKTVLHSVDLFLPAGATVALVGDNGAGKTTIVKLLARMYEPTSGSITLDAVDLRLFPVPAWRARLAGAFQDPARFELLAREVVGIGDLARLEDEAAVLAAIERAGAGEVLDALRDGLDTPLGPSFEGGVELSGGEWQHLALARAMMRERTLLLLLDEPTAALDAGREHRLFERYAAAARVAASETGGVTLLVSHRFSTVRMAEVIVVIEGGRVVEVGTHGELTARQGLYAELFELQSRAYR